MAYAVLRKRQVRETGRSRARDGLWSLTVTWWTSPGAVGAASAPAAKRKRTRETVKERDILACKIY